MNHKEPQFGQKLIQVIALPDGIEWIDSSNHDIIESVKNEYETMAEFEEYRNPSLFNRRVGNVRNGRPRKIHRIFTCYMCPKVFCEKSFLHMHLRIEHSIYKKLFQCEYCEKLYVCQGWYEKHINMHTLKDFDKGDPLRLDNHEGN